MNENINMPYQLVKMGSLPDRTPILIPAYIWPEALINYQEVPLYKLSMVGFVDGVVAGSTHRCIPETWSLWYSNAGNILIKYAMDFDSNKNVFLPAMVNTSQPGKCIADVFHEADDNDVCWNANSVSELHLDPDTAVIHLHDIRYLPGNVAGAVRKAVPVINDLLNALYQRNISYLHETLKTGSIGGPEA